MADITGARAVTNAVLSPNVEFRIGQWTIGYIRRLSESQARPATPLYEIGTVGVVEMTPGQPAPVSLRAEHIELYGSNFVNIVAKAVASGDLSGISPAAGLSVEDTKTAMKQWLEKRLGTDDMGQAFTLADFPVGFQCQLTEQHPVDATKLMITTYENTWFTRYDRPVPASGDLLVIETAEMMAQRVTYKEGVPITKDKVEVISKD